MGPCIDPADPIGMLSDIDDVTAEVFGTEIPLRDRVEMLLDDWRDTSIVLDAGTPFEVADAADDRSRARRGIA